MPGMSGMDFYDELVKRSPVAAERVVFMSGGACTAQGRAFLDHVTNVRIDKPFDVDSVRALVKRQLAVSSVATPKQ